MKLGAVKECRNFDWSYWEAPCWEESESGEKDILLKEEK